MLTISQDHCIGHMNQPSFNIALSKDPNSGGAQIEENNVVVSELSEGLSDAEGDGDLSLIGYPPLDF